ncbi:hypothetical protein BDN67DRAFT_964727 [Paxillus ammoniavirescens]|nr:hypothetical protein BDN67DRAFT_964727 [Paxillus ammoniavirescens]
MSITVTPQPSCSESSMTTRRAPSSRHRAGDEGRSASAWLPSGTPSESKQKTGLGVAWSYKVACRTKL